MGGHHIECEMTRFGSKMWLSEGRNIGSLVRLFEEATGLLRSGEPVEDVWVENGLAVNRKISKISFSFHACEVLQGTTRSKTDGFSCGQNISSAISSVGSSDEWPSSWQDASSER